MAQDPLAHKAIELACYFQNRCCEPEELVEMFCLDAAAAQAITPPITEIKSVELIDAKKERLNDNTKHTSACD